MNPLCLPLLRHAGRLEVLEIEPGSPVSKKSKKQPPVPARVHRRALEKCELRFRDPLPGQLAEDLALLAHARRDASTLTALLRIMALVPSSEERGPCYAPRFGGGRDIRPWLADRVVLRGWLVEMRHLWAQAVAPLVKERILPAWADEFAPSQDGAFCPDIHLMARCSERHDLVVGAFDQRFARRLLPFVTHALRLRQLRDLETTWLSFPALLQMDARLCLLAGHGEAGLGWMKLLVNGPVEWSEKVLTIALEVGVCETAPEPRVRSLLETLRHSPCRWNAAHSLRWAFQGLKKGAGAGWLAGAFRMTRLTRRDLPECEATLLCPSANRLGAVVRAWNAGIYLGWSLWRGASRHAGFCDLLSQISHRHWDNETGLDLLRWLAHFEDAEKREMDGRWAQLRALWPEILRLVRITPKEHRDEMIAFLREGFSEERMESDPDIAGDVLRWAEALCRARSFQPSLKQGHMGLLLLRFNPAQRQRLVERAAYLIESTKKLDHAYTFESHFRMGSACIPLLGRKAVLFLLLREPRRVAKGLALLGHLGSEAADRVCEVFAEHPLNSCSAEECSLTELVVIVEASSLGRCHGITIKDRLRAHLDGSKTLPPHLLAADREKLLNAWARLAIEVLEELVQRELRLMFPIFSSQGVGEGVLMFLHTLDRSQRKGRNLVRRLLLNDAIPKLTRPGNRRWLATLAPGVVEKWTHGLVWSREVPEQGALRLELESDPVEVLRMGEYGNSCLSRGGCCQYSALTNALEANKQVIYARNTSGRVVARQLVAISEQRTLVCFQVYPRAVSREVKLLFSAYDRAFAEVLGLRMETGGEYTIASPLGLDWYDDGVWEEAAIGELVT